MTSIEVKANVLLQETAGRQAIVDRLLARSIWNGLVTALTVPMIAGVLILLVWSIWRQTPPEYSGLLLGGALWALWVSVAVMQVARRIRALATVLERSGVLAQFVRADGKLPHVGS